MPLYISLLTWTDQGARAAKDSVKRYEAATAAAKNLGVTIKDIWWTMGAYDAVTLAEAPDDATVSRFVIAIGAQGNVRTVTMRAYNRAEMERILSGLP